MIERGGGKREDGKKNHRGGRLCFAKPSASIARLSAVLTTYGSNLRLSPLAKPQSLPTAQNFGSFFGEYTANAR